MTETSSPSAPFTVRDYREADRAAASVLGTMVIDWWFVNGPEASLHLVAERSDTGEVVGHLQVVDRSLPAPSRRLGQCHFSLNVALEQRRQGIGGMLYARAESFARGRAARLLYTAYKETEDAPAVTFLRNRGFEPLEWFYPSSLDVAAFDPARFAESLERVYSQGIRLTTYAEAGDSPENRHKLYALEQAAHAVQPFREVGPYVPEPFAKWEAEFVGRDPSTLFLAIAAASDEWVGVVTELEWYFTGVNPAWQGRGIATALKVQCIVEAKRRGIAQMETENHEDNAPMRSVNRKLGFVFTAPEVACIKRL